MRNLREHSGGWQKYTRVAGQLRTEWTKEQPSLREVRTWVGLQASRPEPQRTPDEPDTTIDTDIDEYLESVTAMPSFSDREFHMHEWAEHFSGRVSNEITAIEIRTRLQTLRQQYAPSSCNKRRTALMSFYTSLNGKSGYNPVRDVPKFAEDEEPRDQRVSTIALVLRHMRPSQTRARLRVILWTGWPHAQLKRLKPAHLDLAHARAFVTPRRKGKGRKGTWLPLLPAAVAALREFVAWDCFTPTNPKTGKPVPFSNSSMHKSFALAVGKVNARRARRKMAPLEIHPYDLRHTFGTWVADHDHDERALQTLMMHSRAEQTRRYTERATEKRVAGAVARLSNLRKSTRI